MASARAGEAFDGGGVVIRVTRRTEAPSSLAPKHGPFGDDVKRVLCEDFHGKCYLCEGEARGSFDVEHLRPVCDFPELKFDSNNLFLAHSRCNERRKRWSDSEREPGMKRWPRGGLLDCCRDDVDARLQQVVSTTVKGVEIQFSATVPDDAQARNTAVELNAIHDS